MADNYYDSANTLDSIDVARYIKELAASCHSLHSDGFTQCHCKHQLFVLKCFIDDIYKDLPEFPTQEKEWNQQRLMEILKQ